MSREVGHAGEQYGAYALEARLGGGGNADVWRAQGPDGVVAIKILRTRNTDAEPFRRFAREVDQLRSLGELDGVLPLFDVNLPSEGEGGRAWLTMPVATPIRDVLGEGVSPETKVKAIADIAQTLAALAGRGISHRDVKPENLFELGGRFVLGDFGLVDAPGVASLTEAGTILGPQGYIAPEMISSAADADGASVDVYMLGKTLWVLLTGQQFPLPGSHRLDVAEMRVSSSVAHSRASALDHLIAVMTEHEPARRPSMAQVADELTAWVRLGEARGPEEPVDLGAFIARAAAATARVETEEARFEERKDAVVRTIGDFIASAERATEQLEAVGAPLFRRYGGDAFQTDAIDHLVEVTGMLSVTQMLGDAKPFSQAVGALVSKHERMPGLKIWIGVASIPRQAEAVLAAGSAIVSWGGTRREIWSETRRAILDGPAVRPTMDELVSILVSRLAEDLEAWAQAVEAAARTEI